MNSYITLKQGYWERHLVCQSGDGLGLSRNQDVVVGQKDDQVVITF